MTVVGPKSTGKKKPASKRSPSTKKYDATKPRIQPPNKRTGRDYLDITGNMAKQTAASQRSPMPKMAPKPKKKKKK